MEGEERKEREEGEEGERRGEGGVEEEKRRTIGELVELVDAHGIGKLAVLAGLAVLITHLIFSFPSSFLSP